MKLSCKRIPISLRWLFVCLALLQATAVNGQPTCRDVFYEINFPSTTKGFVENLKLARDQFKGKNQYSDYFFNDRAFNAISEYGTYSKDLISASMFEPQTLSRYSVLYRGRVFIPGYYIASRGNESNFLKVSDQKFYLMSSPYIEFEGGKATIKLDGSKFLRKSLIEKAGSGNIELFRGTTTFEANLMLLLKEFRQLDSRIPLTSQHIEKLENYIQNWMDKVDRQSKSHDPKVELLGRWPKAISELKKPGKTIQDLVELALTQMHGNFDGVFSTTDFIAASDFATGGTWGPRGLGDPVVINYSISPEKFNLASDHIYVGIEGSYLEIAQLSLKSRLNFLDSTIRLKKPMIEKKIAESEKELKIFKDDDGSVYTDPQSLEWALNKVRIVDVRTPEEYIKLHIAGSENYPLGPSLLQYLKNRASTEKIVFVGRDKLDSKQAYVESQKMGLSSTSFLYKGMKDWSLIFRPESHPALYKSDMTN
ncbi:MAG: rhodanese-like domain-containing protein [Pseudobdellovibrionaceae bacterium]